MKSLQQPLPPMPLNRVDGPASHDVHKVELMPLDEAQREIGRAIYLAIRRTNSGLKDFGDKSQVSGWCRGKNPVLARLWQRPDVRRSIVLALAEESGLFDVETHIRERRSA